jgi:hypothetical protein
MSAGLRSVLCAGLSCVLWAAPVAAHGKKQFREGALPTKSEFFGHCPLSVAHPSVTLVRGKVRWANMLSQARTSPPPFGDQKIDFTQQHIAIVALPQTPTPQTSATLDEANPYTYERRKGRLTLNLKVKDEPPAAGEMRAMVVGEPCLVVWLPALRGVREVVVRDIGGSVISQRPVAAVY